MATIIELLAETYIVAMTFALGYIVWALKSQRKDKLSSSNGTMLLLRAQLFEYHEKWTIRGTVTKHGLECFIDMYEIYHELGGNGMVEQLMEDIKNLPIKEG